MRETDPDFGSFHAAYPAMLTRLAQYPDYRNAPRGFPSGEAVGVQYRLTDPTQRIPQIAARRLNLAFNFAESLWYLDGRDDVEFIAYYAPSIRRYSADGIHLTGTAYGRAIFGDQGDRPDQWRSVVEELRSDPDSKRAVLQIFRGQELTVPANPDVSCTLGLQFLIRDGRLHAVGFMRANDAYRGMTSDVFSFTFLQEMLARELGLPLGQYVHSVGSLHVYDSDLPRVREVLADPGAARDPAWLFPALPAGDNWPYLREVLEYEQALRHNRHRLDDRLTGIGLPDYWVQVLLLFEIYRCVVREQQPSENVTQALSPLNRWLVDCWRPNTLRGRIGQAEPMTTDWKQTATVADGFNAYDDLPERAIGYPTVFTELGLGTPGVRTVLDFGCGPGKVALRVVERFPVTVIAVDISPRMLEIARELRSHPDVDYRLISDTGLPFLADESVDAAMSCYVFINIGRLEVIRAIAAEVYRVLRPGGRYVVLDTNPATTGVKFSTFRSGDPGHRYQPGERRRVLLDRPDGQVLELADHHWPTETYRDVLAEAGFGTVTTRQPLLTEVSDLLDARPGTALDTAGPEPAEAVRPPFLIVTGVK